MATKTETSTLQLSISASNLPNVSEGFKESSSPFCVLTMLSNDGSEPQLVGMTEVIENATNLLEFKKNFFVTIAKKDKPAFVLIKIVDEAYDESYREMAEGIFDLQNIQEKKTFFHLAGQHPSDVKEWTVSKKFKNGGLLTLHATEAVSFNILHLKCSGSDFINARGRRKKCIPFYQFSRKNDKFGDEKEIVHTSEKYGDDSLNPSWESESIDVFKLCDGNFNLPFIMSVYHHKSNGKHVLIGEVETSMNQLISEGKVASSGLKLRKKGFHTGVINVDLASIS